MGRLSSQKLYGLVILLAILAGGMMTVYSEQQKQNAQEAESRESLYWQPWEAFGVMCNSEIGHPNLPFPVWIAHPPGTRDMVTEAIGDLVRTGKPPTAWSRELQGSYQILGTNCFWTWSEYYTRVHGGIRSQISMLLENPNNPTEADLRLAILRQEYEAKGRLDRALEMYPVEATERPNR